jgi:nucleotide-binding universal stress UspA family protein
MKRYRTIVAVAMLDERDATTLRHAALFARGGGVEAVYVLHVAPSFDPPPGAAAGAPEGRKPIDEEIVSLLSALVERERGAFPAGTRIECLAREGSLAPEATRLASQKLADLVCIGSLQDDQGQPPGHVRARILRRSPCSVLVVPSGSEPRYERILVPVDFSEPSREALETAAAVASSSPGASLTALHVYNVPVGWHKLGRPHAEVAAMMKEAAERAWAEFLPSVDLRKVPCTARFDLGDRTPATILSAARQIDARLIVAGSHGRTRPAAALLGHVADSLAAAADRPLLCVKKKGEVVNLVRALLELYDLK